MRSLASTRRRARPRNRRGVELVEFLVVFPLLVSGLIAVLEFGIWLLAYQAVVVAAEDGVREAAKGTGITGVQAVVNRVLATHGVVIDNTLASGGDLVLEDGANPPQDINSGLPCSPPSSPNIGAGEVRVTVCVTVTGPGNKPVPNWLAAFGFSTAGRTITATAYARQE